MAPFMPWEIWRGGRIAIPALIHALQDDDNEVSSSASQALTSVGPAAKSSIPSLIDNLRANPRSTEISGLPSGQARALAKDATPALIQALKDDDRGVRVRAWMRSENWVQPKNTSSPSWSKP